MYWDGRIWSNNKNDDLGGRDDLKIKALDSKTDRLSSLSGTHIVEKETTNSFKLSSASPGAHKYINSITTHSIMKSLYHLKMIVSNV